MLNVDISVPIESKWTHSLRAEFRKVQAALNCRFTVLITLSFGVLMSPASRASDRERPVIRVGSKVFTESVVLGEMISLLAKEAGAEAIHHRDLGGTQILYQALVVGDIDVYVEYTGTIREEIFASQSLPTADAIRQQLTNAGIGMSDSLGFENSYALGMAKQNALKRGIKTISDLKKHPELKLGFSNEFMDRSDGWQALKTFYGLQNQAIGLHHDLAYRGIEAGSLDLTDLYTTDAEIEYYDIAVLEDDRNFFTEYEAVLLYRQDFANEHPAVWKSIERLLGAIDASRMSSLNKQAKIDGESASVVAARFLQSKLGVTVESTATGWQSRLWRNTIDHLYLVGVSLAAAIVVAIPVGVVAAKMPRVAQIILGAAGVVQTIPSLALLAFMIPLLGIGATPAIVALFLYSLLPIIRNTYTGIHDMPKQYQESAIALGLTGPARLWRIELPMASRSILAGIKTSAVINVGTATLGALIGAGGYGQPIWTGIRLDNNQLILEGAIPAALLALLVQGLFELSERWLVPRGLRQETLRSRGGLA